MNNGYILSLQALIYWYNSGHENFAWAALKLYDEPIRAWLKEHWLKGAKKIGK